jgi:hypothetical protein
MNNNGNSGCLNQILNTNIGVKQCNESQEIKENKHTRKYHIYKISVYRLHMNDAYIDVSNLIFRALQEVNTI